MAAPEALAAIQAMAVMAHLQTARRHLGPMNRIRAMQALAAAAEAAVASVVGQGTTAAALASLASEPTERRAEGMGEMAVNTPAAGLTALA